MTSLVKKIEERLAEVTSNPQRAPGVYVIVDSNVTGLDQQLRTMAERNGLKRVNLCIGPPPGDYGVSRDADVTVVIYNFARRGQQSVTANFALKDYDLDDEKIDDIMTALGQVLPK